MSRFLTKNAGTLAIAGVGVAALYFLKDFIKIKPDTHEKNMETVIETLNKDANVTKALTNNVRIDADSIQAAIYGTFGFGTDELAIFKIMDQYKTAPQVKALFLAYGERYTAGSWIATGFYKVNLVVALKSELNETDWARISNKFKMAGLTS